MLGEFQMHWLRTAGATLGVALTVMAARVATAPQDPVVPAGAIFDLMLQTALSSKTAKADDRFEATNLQNYERQGQVLVPSGVIVRGFVGSVRPSGGTGHQGQMTLSFDDMKIGERSFKVRATIAIVIDPKRPKSPTSSIDGAPVVGDLSDRSMTPLVGVFVNAGGTLMSTTGADLELPAGAVLRIRLDRPIELK
jgi:hypothetical protein